MVSGSSISRKMDTDKDSSPKRTQKTITVTFDKSGKPVARTVSPTGTSPTSKEHVERHQKAVEKSTISTEKPVQKTQTPTLIEQPTAKEAITIQRKVEGQPVGMRQTYIQQDDQAELVLEEQPEEKAEDVDKEKAED